MPSDFLPFLNILVCILDYVTILKYVYALVLN